MAGEDLEGGTRGPAIVKMKTTIKMKTRIHGKAVASALGCDATQAALEATLRLQVTQGQHEGQTESGFIQS